MINNPGPQLGNYRLLQKLGSGGFADVYLGEHIQLRKRAAVKIFKSSVTSHETPDFLREGRVLASLEHPNIIPVFDCGVEKHTPFLIMTYASGGSLRDRIPRGICPPLQDIVSYVSQTASALYYAHGHGVIHRDIKPENLLLGGQDVVLVSDFGIALLANTTFSRTQSVMGTWAYMAPEQFAGKPCFASDQYALGVVVYEWICGKRPFQGLQEVLPFQHQQVEPPPFRDHNVMVPPAIEQVVMKALAKRPQERFATILDFSNALRQAMLSSTDALEFPVLPQVTMPSLRLRDTKAVSTPPLLTFSPSAKTFVSATRSPYMKLVLVALMVFVIAISSFLVYSKITNSSSASFSNSLAANMTSYSNADIQATATSAIKKYNAAASHAMMFGFDATQTRVNPYEKVITPTNVSNLKLYWSAAYGNVDTSPVVANGSVYTIADKGVLYVSPENCSNPCSPGWQARFGSSSASSPAVADNMVYVASTLGKLYAFNADGCRQYICPPLWVGYTENAIYGSPIIANGVVYVGSKDGNLYAFPAGKCSSICKPIWVGPTNASLYTSPTVFDHTVYVIDKLGMLYAFPTSCDNPCQWQWAVQVDGGHPSTHLQADSLAVADGKLYVSGVDNTFYAFNLSDCNTRRTCVPAWKSSTNGPMYSSPAVIGNMVYAGSDDHSLYAFSTICNNATCAALWRFETGGGISYSSPTVANGVVYFGSEDGYIYAISASCSNPCNRPLWKAHLGSKVHSSPMIANGVLYVGTEGSPGADGRLYAFRLPTIHP